MICKRRLARLTGAIEDRLFGNGGAKLGHGSGGITLLRAA